jgi:hypothetical protein
VYNKSTLKGENKMKRRTTKMGKEHLWQDTILGNKELFRQVDLWAEHESYMNRDEDFFDLSRGFLLRINDSYLYFKDSDDLKLLLSHYKRAGEVKFATPYSDNIKIETVDGYHTIAKFTEDYEYKGEGYRYDWELSHDWKKTIKSYKRLGLIKNECE